MIKKLFFLGIVLAGLITACQPGGSGNDSLASSMEGKTADNRFGDPVDDEGAISYNSLLDQMENRDDTLAVKVKGKVEAVCQAKGCWMNITSDRPEAESMMVKFKDYGFFVPKDIAGREVIMEGYAFREVTPVEELQHLAKDAGQSQDEIDKINEPKVELKFLASGVLLLDAF